MRYGGVLDLEISDVILDSDIVRVLTKHKVVRLGDLVKLSKEDLKSFFSNGKANIQSLSEIEKTIGWLGLSLGMEGVASFG